MVEVKTDCYTEEQELCTSSLWGQYHTCSNTVQGIQPSQAADAANSIVHLVTFVFKTTMATASISLILFLKPIKCLCHKH